MIDFLFELSQLKRIKHEGWRLAGIKDPESVAAHSLHAAQIGYILAKMEKHPDPYKICTMVVFHDIAECRTGDTHKVAAGYIKRDEHKAVKDQTKTLLKTGEEILSLWEETEEGKTHAGLIAKDADLLEQACAAKEYVETGYKEAQNWIENIEKKLKTQSAKKLLSKIKKTNFTHWWKDLKKI